MSDVRGGGISDDRKVVYVRAVTEGEKGQWP